MDWYDADEPDVVVVMESGVNGPEIVILPGDACTKPTSEFDEDTLTRLLTRERQIYQDTLKRKKG